MDRFGAANITLFGSKHSVVGEFGDVIKFTGKDLDEDIGLYYFNARWNDQEVGRFITEDPAKDGANWYVYCQNRPFTFIDPTSNRAYEDGTYTIDTQDSAWNGY